MTDDLSDLLAQHWSADAGPRPGFGGTGTGTPTKYGQGTVVAWNPDTGENQIRYHGVVLRNLPIIGSTEILVIQPGDQVAIMSWAPNGGSGAYWVLGRLVVPGSEAAARSIQFMEAALARQISARVFADRISTDFVLDAGLTTSTSYVAQLDAGGGQFTNGPTVSNVEITDAGKALVIISAFIAVTEDQAIMSFVTSGATSLSADDTRALVLEVNDVGTGSTTSGTMAAAMVIPLTLNPGLHTFSARYRAPDGGSVLFANRSLTVIAF